MAKYFVATTALEEFWDASYPVVFLGEWCKRYSRKSYWEGIRSTTLAPAAKDPFETIKYLNEVHERLLLVLAKILNEVHGLSFSPRYWRIVLGPWLILYVHTLHDKYVQISGVKKQYPDFTTICLDERFFVVPDDTLKFTNLIKGDAYHLQLYSQLFGLSGHAFPTKEKEVTIDAELKESYYVRPKTLANRLFWQMIDLVDKASFKKKKIIFDSIYLPKPALLKLILKMKGRLWPYAAGESSSSNMTVDHDTRKKIGSIGFGDNEFERMLLPLLSQGLPKCMLEVFSRNRAAVRAKCEHPPQAIMSAIGWYCNEEFKVFAAESAEKGTSLLGVQHGGGYGMLEYLFQEEFELSVTDRFFSWGWTKNGSRAKIMPVSATKLIKEKNKQDNKVSGDILYVTSAIFRYMFCYPVGEDFGEDYLRQQAIFLSHLSKNVKERLVIRPHREDGGIDFQQRFRDIIPDVRIDTWAQPFSARDYGLLVCDHPCYSTTFIESLANNKPTIIFANLHLPANKLSQRAKDYWNRLKEIGISYEGPVEASTKIGDIYENIDEWWAQPERQEGVKLFLSEFGRVSEQWEKEWVGILKEYVRE